MYKTIKTVGYTGKYDGANCDRRACGGVVHIQRLVRNGVERLRAVTTNGRYSFVTKIS